MKDIVYFFWIRWKRACQMDSANKLQGKPTHYWIESEEWTSAYKQTLSKNKQQEFDKEWNKLEGQMQAFHDFIPTKKNKTPPPCPLNL